jgi:DNA-directed RNA polymerase specialized sigma24 family protein
MSSGGSITHWIARLTAGDPLAAQKLWEGYGLRLVGLARKKLKGAPRGAADEEDVALSAFDSLCRGAEAGRFPQMLDRDSLWQLLAAITAHKALDLARRERRLKRGGGRVLDEAALRGPADPGEEPAGLEQLLSREPTPEFAAQMAEEFQRLLAGLEDDSLRAVALAKMEGLTNQEVAAQLGCAPRTIDRKLQVIRTLWGQEGSP